MVIFNHFLSCYAAPEKDRSNLFPGILNSKSISFLLINLIVYIAFPGNK